MRNEIVEAHYRRNHGKNIKYITSRIVKKIYRNRHNTLAVRMAEEVVQESYVKALKYFNGFDPNRAAFNTWYNRILNNTLSEVMKGELGVSQEVFYDDTDLEPYKLMENLEIPFELVVLIQEEMKAQPDDRREVLHMFFNLGMKTREIAECVEFSHTNIRQIIRRFRIKFDENSVKLV